MPRKNEYAVLWRNGEEYGITLHLPIAMITKEEGAKSGYKKIDDILLPEPMTSNQFNNYIRTDEGKAWAQNILTEAMRVK